MVTERDLPMRNSLSSIAKAISMCAASCQGMTHLDIRNLLILVQEAVQVPFTGEVLESPERETLGGAVAAYGEDRVQVLVILLEGDVAEEGFELGFWRVDG